MTGVAAAVESGEVASRMEALSVGVADLVHRYFVFGVFCLVFGIWCLVFEPELQKRANRLVLIFPGQC